MADRASATKRAAALAARGTGLSLETVLAYAEREAGRADADGVAYDFGMLAEDVTAALVADGLIAA